MSKSSIGRREFALGAAAVATTALIHPTEALAHAEPSQASAATPPPSAARGTNLLDQQAQAALAKLTPQQRAEVEMKVANIFRKYGDKLSEDQKADIRRAMAETQDGLEKMRAFALDNSDQPATVFQPHGFQSKHKEGKR